MTQTAPKTHTSSLPTLLTRLLSDVRQQGFHHSKCFPEERLLDLSRLLGSPRGDVRDPRIIRVLKPQVSDDAPSNTLSSRYGIGAFPFHTETAYWYRPARFLVLHCSNPGSGTRPTLLVDTRTWRLDDSERRLLANAAWKVSSKRVFLFSVLEVGCR